MVGGTVGNVAIVSSVLLCFRRSFCAVVVVVVVDVAAVAGLSSRHLLYVLRKDGLRAAAWVTQDPCF